VHIKNKKREDTMSTIQNMSQSQAFQSLNLNQTSLKQVVASQEENVTSSSSVSAHPQNSTQAAEMLF
jgi:hypothetical protein